MPRSSYLAILTGLAAFGLAACNSNDAAAPVSVTGTYALSVAASTIGENCQGSGSLNLLQSGNTLNGDVSGLNVVCTGAATITRSISGTLTNGKIDGNHVTASDGTCSYDGHATGDPATSIEGSLACTVAINSTNVTITGTFSAIR